ncbi:MAG: beta-hydroxyacyl-ACP dehydratase [Methylococcaceae bacterium]|nr:beta-hydroxyacyl-ACP dehydratase [Methylococcaceae bacterium]
MSNMIQQYCIAANHPCFAGHFPGNPIVPGVVILDYARDLLQQWQPNCRIKTITQVKFLQPLHPEQAFTITLSQGAANSIKFVCSCGERRIVTGAFLTESRS